MPRKKNAKKVYKPRKLKNVPKVPKVVILPICKSIDDGISPGKLRAVAEWR